MRHVLAPDAADADAPVAAGATAERAVDAAGRIDRKPWIARCDLVAVLLIGVGFGASGGRAIWRRDGRHDVGRRLPGAIGPEQFDGDVTSAAVNRNALLL